MKILSVLTVLLAISWFNDSMGQVIARHRGFNIHDDSNGMDLAMMEPDSTAKIIYIKSSGSVGLGTSTPDNSALLDIPSSTRGILLPRMTMSSATRLPALRKD
jgi:hypothetical protein